MLKTFYKKQNFVIFQIKAFKIQPKKSQKIAEGKGVGLYLSGQIIKYHQGKAWAESEGEGKGSTFYIELPLKIKDETLAETSMPIGKI